MLGQRDRSDKWAMTEWWRCLVFDVSLVPYPTRLIGQLQTNHQDPSSTLQACTDREYLEGTSFIKGRELAEVM